jgi:gliding motility-associated-like protein
VSPAVTTQYLVAASNGNNCTATDSVTVTVIPLPIPNVGNDTVINRGESAQLNATGGSTYLWKPSTGLTCVDCSNPLASPGTTTEYTVIVTNSNGCSDSATVTVTVRANNVVFIPDVFSPNGDGQNDVLYIRGNGIKELHFALYDRWGEKVFETRDQSVGWDGTRKGNQLNSAVFVYYAKVTFVNGDKTTLKGDISLVR